VVDRHHVAVWFPAAWQSPLRFMKYNRPILCVVFTTIAVLTLIVGAGMVLIGFSAEGSPALGIGVVLSGLFIFGIAQIVEFLSQMAHNTALVANNTALIAMSAKELRQDVFQLTSSRSNETTPIIEEESAE